MDAVITYVNGADPAWQADFLAATGTPPDLAKRYRDWGTLKYLVRGIRKFMPFIDKVFLVVARESQVPEWGVGELNVVLHKDIIPPQFLPTFNSTTIEMFLYRIPGLDEQFIYFNDDIFPLRPTSADVFFPDGKPAKKMTRHFFALNGYKKQTLHSDRMARKAAGIGHGLGFIRPQHSVTPLLKSACGEVMQKVGEDIASTLTRVRVPANLNQYVFSDYLFFTGRATNRRISQKHLSLATHSPADIAEYLHNPTHDFACINDVEMPVERFLATRTALIEAFDAVFSEAET